MQIKSSRSLIKKNANKVEVNSRKERIDLIKENLQTEINQLKILNDNQNGLIDKLISENKFLQQKEEAFNMVADKDKKLNLELSKIIVTLEKENSEIKNSLALSLKPAYDFENEIGIDTSDLILKRNKQVGTEGFKIIKAYQNQEIQTEILNNFNFILNNRNIQEKEQNSNLQEINDEIIHFKFPKEEIIAINIASEKNESLTSRSYHLFKSTLQKFLKDLESILNDFKEKYHYMGWDSTLCDRILENHKNIIEIKEKFYEEIEFLEKTNLNSLTQLKINLIEAEIQRNESNSEKKQARLELEKIKSKFEAFFKSLIRIKIEDKEGNPDLLEKEKEKESLQVNFTEVSNEEPKSLNTIDSSPKSLQKIIKSRKSLIFLTALKSKSSKIIKQESPKLAIHNSENTNKLIFVKNDENNNEPLEIENFLKTVDEKIRENKESETVLKKKLNENNENTFHQMADLHFALSKKLNFSKIQTPNFDKCFNFLLRINVSELQPRKNVSLQTIIKTISLIQIDLIKKINSEKGKNSNWVPLFYYLYEILFVKYNKSREQTEKKLLKIIQGCLNYLELPRVLSFAKFLNIIPDEQNKYDGDDLFLYCNLLSHLDDNPMIHIPGLTLAMSPQDKVSIYI